MADFQNTEIRLPARSVYAGDLMDCALDKLRTIQLALAPDNKEWRDEDALHSVWATLDQAIRDLEPVRDRLQGVGRNAQDVIQEMRAELARSAENKQA